MRSWKIISNFAHKYHFKIILNKIKKYKYETNFITPGSRNG